MTQRQFDVMMQRFPRCIARPISIIRLGFLLFCLAMIGLLVLATVFLTPMPKQLSADKKVSTQTAMLQNVKAKLKFATLRGWLF
jgi:hypothetical protein